MRSLFNIISDLIMLAEEMIVRPAASTSVPRVQRLATLGAEVRAADARPAEDVRTTRAALVMVIALDEFLGAEVTDDTSVRWLMIAGTALPQLRAEAYAALRNERAGRAAHD